MPYFKEEIQRQLAVLLFVCVTALMTSSQAKIQQTQVIQFDEIYIELNATEAFLYKHIQSKAKNMSHLEMYQTAQTIATESDRHGLDPLLILSMITEESRFNAHAKGIHGEIGLMQILPTTAKWMSEKAKINFSGVSDLNNPIVNVKIGIAYVTWLKKRFNEKMDYVSAYNMGPKNLRVLKNSAVQPMIYFNKIDSHYTIYLNDLDKNVPTKTVGRVYALNN